jgi:hypothetical protein
VKRRLRSVSRIARRKREAGESVWLFFVSVAQAPGLLRTYHLPSCILQISLLYQQEYLARAELRGKNVHSSGDVWREARQVENDAEYGARYYQLYRAEALDAIAMRIVSIST